MSCCCVKASAFGPDIVSWAWREYLAAHLSESCMEHGKKCGVHVMPRSGLPEPCKEPVVYVLGPDAGTYCAKHGKALIKQGLKVLEEKR